MNLLRHYDSLIFNKPLLSEKKRDNLTSLKDKQQDLLKINHYMSQINIISCIIADFIDFF